MSVCLENIEVSYNHRTTLNVPHLEIDSRPTLLLGPNGAGKTTLMNIAAQTAKPSSGRVVCDARTVYVAQKFAPIIGFTCVEYCAYVAWLQGQSRALAIRQAADQLAFVGLASMRSARCETLSGGESARLAVATALNSGASTLLLDEPSASLDPHSKQQLTEIYQRVVDRGQNLVVSTHDAAELHAPFERVLVLLEGRIEFDGSRARFAELGRTENSPVAALSRAFMARGRAT